MGLLQGVKGASRWGGDLAANETLTLGHLNERLTHITSPK